MAYKEVPADPPKSFFKFAQLNDWIEGRYVSATEGVYGLDVTLSHTRGRGSLAKDAPSGGFKDGATRTFTCKGMLRGQVEKACLQPGYLICAIHKTNQDVGKDSDMKVYKFMVDDNPPAPGAPGAVAPAARRAAPPPPPAPEADDGVPF